MDDDMAQIRRRVGFLTELAILGGAAIFAYLVYRAAAYKFFLSRPVAALCGVAGLVVASFVLTRLRDARGFNANAAAVLVAMIAAGAAVAWKLWWNWPYLVSHLGLIAAGVIVLAGAIGLFAKLAGRTT